MENIGPTGIAENECSEAHDGSLSEGDEDHLSDPNSQSEFGKWYCTSSC